jgi:hypothetical protein
MGVKVTITIPEWLDKICVWPVMVYRKIKYGCVFRRIPLGDGKYVVVDAEDYYRFGCFRWSDLGGSRNIYAARTIRDKKGKIRLVALHKEIMKPPRRRVVDHRNGNSQDDRRANLRTATYLQNSCNRGKKRNATSKYIGVSFEKQTKKWGVTIKYRGKHIRIGRFKTEIEGALAYDRAALKYRGEYARLNFPPKESVVPCLPGRVFGLKD